MTSEAGSNEHSSVAEVDVTELEERQRRAALLAASANIMDLIFSKLSRYRITDSNPLDTGSINLSTQEIMGAVGVWNVRSAARQVSLGAAAVKEVKNLELEKVEELSRSSNGLVETDSDDDATA